MTSSPIWARPSRAAWGWRRVANLNPEGNYPSLFQAIHGEQPPRPGNKGIANPVATIWSVAMMLDHLDETELGKVVLGAVESVIAAGKVCTGPRRERYDKTDGAGDHRHTAEAGTDPVKLPPSGILAGERLVCPFELTRWRGGRCAWRALVRGCASSELAPELGKPL